MSNYFVDKVVWLTGASSGIGEALAIELAARGAKLAITARRAEILTRLSNDLSAKGGAVAALPGDVEDRSQMHEVAQEIRARFGKIDCLISNAGTHRFTVPEKFDAEEYRAIMNLNFGGMLNCIEAVLPEMIESKSGHIVAVASLAGYRALPRAAAYGASKAAMIHFLDSLRFHMAEYNIPVTTVNPGFVKTPLTDKNDFSMPFLVSAADAAKTICNGVAKQKAEVAFPFLFTQILRVGRLLPASIYEPLARMIWARCQPKSAQ